MKHYYLVCLLIVCSQVQILQSASNQRMLSEEEIDLVIAHPDIRFVYLPKEIGACISELPQITCLKNCSCAVQDVYLLSFNHSSIMRHDCAVTAIPEIKKIYQDHRPEFLDVSLCDYMVRKLEAYETALAKGDADFVCSVDDRSGKCASVKVECNLIVNNNTQLNTLTVLGDQSIAGKLFVDNIYTASINNVPFDQLSTYTFTDNKFFIVDAADSSKQFIFDIQGSPSTVTTFVTNPSTNRTITAPDIDGTIVVAQTGTNEVFIGSTGPLHGSNSGIQYSTTFANRAQLRTNQYGANTGIPGISTFKSRGTNIGDLAPVQAGDVIYRATAVGVTDNLSIPLSGLISVNVAPGGVPAGQGYIATDYELQLVSLDGPANGRRPVYKITSEGVVQMLETTSSGPHTTVPSGVITLDSTGNFIVANSKLAANARILLTVQPGPLPTGMICVSALTANSGFTITSTAGAADAGVNVYYQIYTPLS